MRSRWHCGAASYAVPMMTVEAFAAGLVPEPPGAAVAVSLDDVDDYPDAVVEAAVGAIARHHGIVVGVARRRLQGAAASVARACTTTVAPRDIGELGVAVPDAVGAAARLCEVGASLPARVLAQVLRATSTLPVHDAVIVESLAYSTLLGGEDFRAWRAATPARDRDPSVDAVRVSRAGNVLEIVLARPERRNALDATARRDLVEALEIAVADRAVRVEIAGEGACFCSGGDIDEFGTATDLAVAHALRTEHGPAATMATVGGRVTARVHGPCVGAGVELAAFARTVVAAPGTTFRLPEVAMGLIPGAGGTVSVARRIGRWRAAWWMFTDEVIDVDLALAWGLVDRVE